MRRLRPGLPLILVLVSLALLSVAAPSWAHTGSAAPGSNAVSDEALSRFTLSAAPEAPGLPWPALLGALVVVALSWRRPRRALALAIVLLLAVFVFEDGLHSVHHLADRSKTARCAIAVATAHLTATAVDGGGAVHEFLPVIAVLAEVGQPDPVTRILSPVLGRAPPPTAA